MLSVLYQISMFFTKVFLFWYRNIIWAHTIIIPGGNTSPTHFPGNVTQKMQEYLSSPNEPSESFHEFRWLVLCFL